MKCPAETDLSTRELAEIKSAGDVFDVGRGSRYCEYPAETMHFHHAAAVQQASTAPDDDPPSLWLMWSDDGRRELRWSAGCLVRLPSRDEPDGDLCVLPAGHGGKCDQELNNEFRPGKELREKFHQMHARLQRIRMARALGCPTVVIRDGEQGESDFVRWSDLDHVAACPSDLPCHQAAVLADADDLVGLRAFLAPYST